MRDQPLFHYPILWSYGIYSVTCLAIVAIIAMIILCFPLKLESRRKVTATGARFWFKLSGVELCVSGMEQITQRPFVAVANHASYIDGILLHAILPTRFSFVIKREVTKAPFIHFILRRIGADFVERSDRHLGGIDARKIVKKVKHGTSMAVFPEGTFIDEPGLGIFRAGAFAAAVAGNTAVVPIVIIGSRYVLPASRWLPRRGPVTIKILSPIECPGSDRAAMRQLANLSRQAILQHLDEPDRVADQNPTALDGKSGRT